MANQNWDAIDEKKRNFKEVYCAFIDILGYKEKMSLFFSNRYNLLDRIDRAFNSIITIDVLSRTLVDKSDRHIQIFSDSIIITYPVRKYALSSLFQDVNTVAAHLSFEDLFVRGGIAKGKHINTETETSKLPFLASEALAKAYELEQKAKMPRILIEKNLESTFDINDKIFIIKENEDYIVHFAQVMINRNGNNYADVKAEMEDIYTRKMKEDNMEIKEKYQWILDYYYWTITQSQGYNLENFKKFSSLKDRKFKKIG